MDKEEKELAVMNLLLTHGVSRASALTAISEMWNEQDLDELISLQAEDLAEIARDIIEALEE